MMSSFKSEIRAIIHSVYDAGRESEYASNTNKRKDVEAQAIKSIMQKHRANYTKHFAKAARKGQIA